MIHIYTGNGKGKTTAALGLILRAMGHNKKIAMIQFLKGDKNYGEYRFLNDKILIEQYGRNEFVNPDNPESIDIEYAKRGFKRAMEIINSDKYDLIVLDEINVAYAFGLIDRESIMSIFDTDKKAEIILTGRGADRDMIERADLVTEMKEIKHYFTKGINAREGVEY